MISPDDLESVQMRIEDTERRLTEKIGELPFKVNAKPSKPKKQQVAIKCASCSTPQTIQMRIRKGAKKLVKCDTCENYSQVSALDSDDVDVTQVPMYEFVGNCPVCVTEIREQIPAYAGAMITPTCPNCEVRLLLSKTATDANLKIPRAKRNEISSQVVGAVREKLPDRPWPKHIHKTIATELKLSNSIVSRAIGSLIEQGYFPLEENGESNAEKNGT